MPFSHSTGKLLSLGPRPRNTRDTARANNGRLCFLHLLLWDRAAHSHPFFIQSHSPVSRPSKRWRCLFVQNLADADASNPERYLRPRPESTSRLRRSETPLSSSRSPERKSPAESGRGRGGAMTTTLFPGSGEIMGLDLVRVRLRFLQSRT